MSGVTVVYGCLCSDAAAVIDDMPALCPGHGGPVVGQWPNTNPGGLRFGHDCPIHPCDTTHPAPTGATDDDTDRTETEETG